MGILTVKIGWESLIHPLKLEPVLVINHPNVNVIESLLRRVVLEILYNRVSTLSPGYWIPIRSTAVNDLRGFGISI